MNADAATERALVEVFREEAGHITSALIRRFGDFDVAEESAQDALVAALETWPGTGVPERPAAWLLTVASRRALNRLDRGRRLRQKVAQLAAEPPLEQEDDRLRLIFTCCRPAAVIFAYEEGSGSRLRPLEQVALLNAQPERLTSIEARLRARSRASSRTFQRRPPNSQLWTSTSENAPSPVRSSSMSASTASRSGA